MWEADAANLARAMERDLSGEPEPAWPLEGAPPPVRVLDCVLSLNRQYMKVVLPRVTAFWKRFPEVVECEHLRDRMLAARSPAAFLADACNLRDARRADMLLGVTEYLIDIQRRFDGPTQHERLSAWARWARPGDYLATGVPGFGLAGFQYLRMHFGADTTKPDVHIVGYVVKALGRKVSAIHALYILERAAELSGQSARRLDALIWERNARR